MYCPCSDDLTAARLAHKDLTSFELEELGF